MLSTLTHGPSPTSRVDSYLCQTGTWSTRASSHMASTARSTSGQTWRSSWIVSTNCIPPAILTRLRPFGGSSDVADPGDGPFLGLERTSRNPDTPLEHPHRTVGHPHRPDRWAPPPDRWTDRRGALNAQRTVENSCPSLPRDTIHTDWAVGGVFACK